MKFKPFPKIDRFQLSMVVTRKMDGTNASVHIFRTGVLDKLGYPEFEHKKESFTNTKVPPTSVVTIDGVQYYIYTASKNRWTYPEADGDKGSDNHGWAAFVRENAEEFVKYLGDGRHFGEWCGPGIQGNRHQLPEKRFYLFNVEKWWQEPHESDWPSWLTVVEPLYEGKYNEDIINHWLLIEYNTFGKGCEGVVVYIPEADHLTKRTVEYPEGKWRKK